MGARGLVTDNFCMLKNFRDPVSQLQVLSRTCSWSDFQVLTNMLGACSSRPLSKRFRERLVPESWLSSRTACEESSRSWTATHRAYQHIFRGFKSSRTVRRHRASRPLSKSFLKVGARGLEPPSLAAYGPEPYVSAISPRAHHLFTCP